MKKFNKTMSLLLVLAMVLGLAACGAKPEAPETTAAPAPAATEAAGEPVTYVDPYADAADDYDELSAAVYEDALGEFNTYYQEAVEETSTAMRYAKMAIAEAKLLESGAFLPMTSRGGLYAMTRVAPYSASSVLWGSDGDRLHDIVVTTEPILAEDYLAMRAKWTELVGTGEYEAWMKGFLTEKGYETKTDYTQYYTADPQTWDVLATSQQEDSEKLFQTVDGLVEYGMENELKPALAESWEVSDDGLTYTFHLRQGAKWVDNQGREVAEVTADDFVAGFQHMMDTMGGLEYLINGDVGVAIVGARDYIDGTVVDMSKVGVKAVDDYTLTYTLEAPADYFMTMLGYGVFCPMNRAYYESMGGQFGAEYDSSAASYKYGKGPDSIIYNGPFVITNFTSNNTIAFAENKAYWNAGDNNITSMTWIYNDSSGVTRNYTEFFDGTVDSQSLVPERLEMAKKDGNFEKYAYVSLLDSTTFVGFLNVRRHAFNAPHNEAIGVSTKTDAQKEQTAAALLNNHFRLALLTAIDRSAYNAQRNGEETKLNNISNSYTPGTFCSLPEEVTVAINGTDTTFPAGTMYGAIVQAQLDADGVPLKAWDGNSSSGFDGWNVPEFAASELEKAIEELAAQGVEISAENPVLIDVPQASAIDSIDKQNQAIKQSVEATLGGKVIINLIDNPTQDDYLYSTYYFGNGEEANFDLNTGSGWGPDYGDPSTYLGTMLPDYSGYMTRCMGLF